MVFSLLLKYFLLDSSHSLMENDFGREKFAISFISGPWSAYSGYFGHFLVLTEYLLVFVKIDDILYLPCLLCLLFLMIYMNTPLSEVSFHVSCVPTSGLSSCYSP